MRLLLLVCLSMRLRQLFLLVVVFVLIGSMVLIGSGGGAYHAVGACNRVFAPLIAGLKFPIWETDHAPKVMLWAWETSTDLSWIDAKKVGVAFLSETITMSEDHLWAKPRIQRLVVPPDTYLTAVVRIESSRVKPPALSDEQLDQVVNCIKSRVNGKEIKTLQIDFDAARSQRQFYRRLLTRLRSELPDITLSMTALASWCIGDPWLKNLDVDEVVPMFFDMGADKQNVFFHLASGKPVKSFGKRLSVGLAADDKEALALFVRGGKTGMMLSGKRLYLFSGRGWNKTKLTHVLDSVEI